MLFNKMNNGPSNTNKSAQEQRSMQHRQQQQKQQDRQQRNQQHSQCNKALKMDTKKTDTMNGDMCNNNKTNNKNAPLKTNTKISKNETNNNKENNYKEKGNHQSLCAYNCRRNYNSYTISKASVSAGPKKVISGSWKCSDKRQIHNSSNNIIPQRTKILQKQQYSQPMVQFSNGNLKNTSGTKASSRTYMTSICRPGILYSDVLFGPGTSSCFVKVKILAPRVTNVGVGAQSGARSRLATPPVQNGTTLLKYRKSTAPENMPPKSSELKSINPDLSSTPFNKSTCSTSSMFAKSGNDRGNANGPGYNNNNNRANGNSNAVGTDPYKIYGNVIPTNNFHSKQEMMPIGVATAPKVIQGATTLPTMIPNSTKFASNGGMTIQNGLTNAIPIKCYNNDGVTFGTGLEKYFSNQTNNQVMDMNPIKTMPASMSMPMSTPIRTTNDINCTGSHSGLQSSSALVSNSYQMPMKSAAVIPCPTTNSPKPFFVQIPIWNLIDVSREIYPKFLRQFDDGNYLKLEASAILGLQLALQNNSKQKPNFNFQT